MNFDLIAYGLGALAAGGALWLSVTLLIRFLKWVERSEIARQQAEAAAERQNKTARAAPEPEGVPADHVVAIAAAVAAYGFRVVHISDPASGRAWAAEGRWMHQTSHRPH